MMRPFRRLGAPLLAALLLACAVNPVTHERELVFTSVEEERAAGEEGAEMVAREMGLVGDRALTAYVEAVGRRLARHAPQSGADYRFAVVDIVEPNAFALPGGRVYVSRGLLALCGREDDLASAMAHEIIHVAARHHAQRSTRATGIGILALPALLAGAILPGPLGDLVAAPVAVAGLGVLAAHGREQEREADRFGQRLAATAGYDPAALADFLARLEAVGALQEGPRRTPGFFDTHPTTPQRTGEARRAAADIAWTPAPGVGSGRRGFLRRIEGLRLGANPAGGVFEGQRFVHPDLDLTVVFPDGWETLNTPEAAGAVAADGSAEVSLRGAGKGDDPREAASAFLQEASSRARLEVARTGSLALDGGEAVRVLAVTSGRGGRVSLDLTWVPHRGRVYLLAGVVSGRYRDAHRETFERVARSLRTLRPSERDAVRELRLRLRPARAGETLEALSRRTGNRWSVAQTAAANGLAPEARLRDEQVVKVAIAEPYRGRPQ